MIIGGSCDGNKEWRRRYQRYDVTIAGEHHGADIQGDWSTERFWKGVDVHKPNVVVLIAILPSQSIKYMKDILQKRVIMFLWVPRLLWLNQYMSDLFSPHYEITRYGTSPLEVVVAFSPTFPQRNLGDLYPLLDNTDRKDVRRTVTLYDAIDDYVEQIV